MTISIITIISATVTIITIIVVGGILVIRLCNAMSEWNPRDRNRFDHWYNTELQRTHPILD